MDYINKEYGVKSVNLEGGAKSYNLSPLTSITEAEIRQRVSDYFVKNGRVNGAEYFAINNPGKINLWGLEDTRLYVANLEIYRASLKYKREVDKLLGNLSYILTNLKIKIYNRELLEFDSKYIQYKAGNLEFKEYLSYILAKAKEKGLELEPRASLRLLEKALLEEPNIDFKKANIERDRFVDALKNKLSSRTLDELIAKTAQFKNGRVSQKDFYDFLIEKAKVVNVDAGSYPELKKYVDYVSTYKSVDKMKVMVEIAELESKLKDAMIENDTQRKLDLLSKNLALLKNVFNISLSKDDYKYFVSNKDSFDMRHYIAFIEKEAPRHNIVAKLEEGISDVDGYREDIAKFYEYSMKRDEAFLKNLKYERTSGKNDASQEIAVMVTGGFHSENLAEHFRKNNIAYVSIMPNFRNNKGYKAPYMDLLAGQETQVERAIDAALSSMQIYDYLTELGIAVDGERGLKRFELSVKIITALERGQVYTIKTPFNEIITFYKDEATGDVKYRIERFDLSDPAQKSNWDKIEADALIKSKSDIGPLLYKTHEEMIDAQLAEAYKPENRADRVKPVPQEDLDAVAGFFANTLGARGKELADRLRELHASQRVNVVTGLDGFDGHAGKEGIHINASGTNTRAVLANRTMAYFFDMGRDFNYLVEAVYLAYAANPEKPSYKEISPQSIAVDMSNAAFSPLSERDQLKRERIGRDYTTKSDDRYLEALFEKGARGRVDALTGVNEAGAVYDEILTVVPAVIDIMNRDVNTYVISPAPDKDYALTVKWAHNLRKAFGKKQNWLVPKYYRIGDAKGLADELMDILGKDKDHPGFLDNVLTQRKTGKVTDRLCVRVIGKEGRDSFEKIFRDNERVKALSEDDRNFLWSKIRVENVLNAETVEHLNPAADLFTDILAMEFDRFLQGDYGIDTPPDSLSEKLGIMLQLTTDNIDSNMVTKGELVTTIKSCLTAR